MAELAAWLEEIGLGHYADAFAEAAIDLDVLADLSEADLADLGVKLGDRKRLLKAIAARQVRDATTGSLDRPEASAPVSAAERRQLTVMFVDLVGSTALSRRLDPEDMSAVMRSYHGRASEVIQRWGGHVAKYLGDGVLAYFGWPQAHEDDAERAVRAGLALAEALTGIDDGAGGKLSVRIGIATGPVVVGELIGEGAAQEQAVVGETPNLAARLQGLAGPGTVVIGGTTRRLVGDLFDLTDLGPRRLKGFAEPLSAWRVEAEAAAESRFEAMRGRRLTPLVGRAHELGLLLDRWSRAKDGEGQVVLLSGEAGIGKSRLIQAVRERIADDPHTPLPHYGSAHHTSSAFHTIVQLLERAAGFAREDPPAVRLDKLGALLRPSTPELATALALIAPLLSLDSPAPLALTPQRRKQLILEALVGQVEKLSRRAPVLAIYEDVHWFDPSSLEVVERLIERARDLRVLVVISFRPDFTPRWRPDGDVTYLSLTRLGRRDGAAMVASISKSRALPPEIEAELLARTDGVPLFVEEMTKAILESGLLQESGDGYRLNAPLPALAIPSSLHDSLMARLDRLAAVKDVAQVASVIGRDFSRRLLAGVADWPEQELSAALAELEAADLIRRRDHGLETTYAFKHALVQDAAYQSLLKSRRQELHARVAAALEDGCPEVANVEPEVLAHHSTEAGLAEPAVAYWSRAGHRAAERSAYAEASAHFRRGLELLRTLPEGLERDHRELDLLTALGSILISTKGHPSPEVADVYLRARDLCHGLNDTPHLAPVLQGLRLRCMLRADLGLAREAAEELSVTASRAGDDGYRLEAQRALGVVSFYVGDLVVARDFFEGALALYDVEVHRAHALRYEDDPGMTCLSYLGRTLWLLGHPEQALGPVGEAVELARALGHIPSLAEASVWQADLFLLRRQTDLCREQAAAALAFASEHGFPLWTALAGASWGWAEAHAGEGEAGITALRRALDGLQRIGDRLFRPRYQALLADALRHLGRPREALAEVDQAMEWARGTDARYWNAELHRLRGELLSQGDGAAPQAEASFWAALEIARSQEAKSLELRAATNLARLWAEQGERRKAQDLLSPLYGWFTEGFDTRDLKDAKALLDQLV